MKEKLILNARGIKWFLFCLTILCFTGFASKTYHHLNYEFLSSDTLFFLVVSLFFGYRMQSYKREKIRLDLMLKSFIPILVILLIFYFLFEINTNTSNETLIDN